MKQEKLCLTNLPHLENGIIEEAFNAELARLVRDCEERPLDKSPRTLQLQVNLKPKPEMSAGGIICDEVEVECAVTGKIPVQRTKTYVMKPKHDGTIAFHPDLPDEPDGSTIMEEAERNRALR